MLARSALRPALRATSAAPARAFSTSAPQQATLRELETRLRSVRNIEKITKSMKMIAATKLTKAQRAMASARAYGEANEEVFKNSEATSPEGGKVLYVVISSDKGLCGGIHSSVVKRAKKEMLKLGESAGSADTTDGPAIFALGDKPKAQLSRALPKNLAVTFSQVGRDVPTFADASAVADKIVSSGISFDKVNIIYNSYVSAMSFESAVAEVFSEQALRDAAGFKTYEQEEDTTKDLAEFALANAIYATLVEGHAAEINSRRNAMDNASKNAGDMINSLNLQFNRSRQAQITNDLVDIVTGAAALS
ncbi:unnamed protein product [Sympodiomycopsis kandeliae]